MAGSRGSEVVTRTWFLSLSPVFLWVDFLLTQALSRWWFLGAPGLHLLTETTTERKYLILGGPFKSQTDSYLAHVAP